MNTSYVSIEAELLKRLSQGERLTAVEIAARIGCAPNTILRRLRRFGIPARPQGPVRQARTLNGDIRWSPALAYAIGLIATDGNLSGDGRHLTVTSKDRDLLETLRALAIPDAVFADFVRGCIDGDGSVTVYVDTQHTDKRACYVDERLYVSLVSASRAFLDWIQATIHRLLSMNGSVAARRHGRWDDRGRGGCTIGTRPRPP